VGGVEGVGRPGESAHPRDGIASSGTMSPATLPAGKLVLSLSFLTSVGVLWSLSRRARNRLLHALNGNPSLASPGRQRRPQNASSGSGWTQVGCKLDGRALMEPLPAGKLRASGFTLPPAIKDDYVFRVYDTRLKPAWLSELAGEVVPSIDRETVVVGGDFMLPTFKEDGAAFTSSLTRWGGEEPYHIVVPPRPHLAKWLERCHHQLSVEVPDTRFSVCCVVSREACPSLFDMASIRRVVPQAEPLLSDPRVELKVFAVGERPPIVRVPADSMVLPPAKWEEGLLPRNKVLLVLHFRRTLSERVAPSGEWIRGHLPDPAPSELEFLRLTCMLPEAASSSFAERHVRRALAKLAQEMSLPAPHSQQLRQVQVDKGAVYALLGVPRATALQWLRGSGCGGLFLRPFWTEQSGAAVGRDRFSLVWLRAPLAKGPALWEALRQQDDVYGLLPGDKDLAIRVASTASEVAMAAIRSQVEFVLHEPGVVLRQAVRGHRWWCLGPLTEEECWRKKDLILSTGLVPLRDEMRMKKLGPFRFCVYFSAVGEPNVLTLDDGSWNASAARLQPVDPPPRPLPSTATWGRRASSNNPSPPAAHPTAAPPHRAAPPRKVAFSSWPPLATSPSPSPVASASPPPVASASPSSLTRRQQRQLSRSPPSSVPPAPAAAVLPSTLESRLDMLIAQVAELSRQNASLSAELRALREENAGLRNQLAMGRMPVPLPLLPPPPTSFAPLAPRPGTPPSVPGDTAGASPSPAKLPEPVPKRSRADEGESSPHDV
jgi:hypothetical protein